MGRSCSQRVTELAEPVEQPELVGVLDHAALAALGSWATIGTRFDHSSSWSAAASTICSSTLALQRAQRREPPQAVGAHQPVSGSTSPQSAPFARADQRVEGLVGREAATSITRRRWAF